MKSIVLKMLFFIIVLYAGVNYLLYSTQESKIFLTKYIKECNLSSAKLVHFRTSDNINLEGAYFEHKKGAPLVLYFGGNAEDVKCFIQNVSSKIDGYNFIAFNYPGYAKSEGKPSEEKILQYALELYKKYHPDIVAGRSLGSAVAIYVASKEPIEKLLLITPIDSIENIAKSKFPYLPISLILKHKFQAIKWVESIQAKVALLLVENENVVPRESVENILNATSNIVFKKVIKGANHKNIYEVENTISAIKEALKALKEQK
jgi:esterase/lipase